MKQTMLSKQDRPLLAYAISKLNPEVFSHPVWVRFGKQDVFCSTGIIDDLFRTVERFEKDDPGSACQILLVCAAYQKQAHKGHEAFSTIQRALELAVGANLAKETIWAIWGACSISIQLGNYEQAETELLDLQAALNQQDEWILADLIDVLRQSFQQMRTANQKKHTFPENEQTSAQLLTFGVEWLQNWGRPVYIPEANPKKSFMEATTPVLSRSTALGSFFSFQRWQLQWHSLLLAIRSELSLQWTEDESQRTKKQFSFWELISSRPRLSKSSTIIDAQVVEEVSAAEVIPILAPAKEDVPPMNELRKKKTVSTDQKAGLKRRVIQETIFIPITVHMLGPYSLVIADQTVEFPSSRGLSVLKYLLLHHKQKIPREILMEVFWENAAPETARKNLNVAMHSLRKSLRAAFFPPVIIYENGAYSLDPNLQIWLDVDEFEKCVKAGQYFEMRDQIKSAVAQYETAISLYQGDFLQENPYEEWTIHDRERLRVAYLDTIERLSQIYFQQESYAACIHVCQRILSYDPCREDACCLLMRCFSRQGQDHLALRQYQSCVKALRAELDAEPTPETTRIYGRIRRHEAV